MEKDIQPQSVKEINMGKGSKARPFEITQQDFDRRWEETFGKKKTQEPAATSDDKKEEETDTDDAPKNHD